VGLFLRTHNQDEDAQAAFSNVKLTAVPDRSKLKQLQETTRAAAIAQAPADVARRSVLHRIQKDEAAGLINKDWVQAWDVRETRNLSRASNAGHENVVLVKTYWDGEARFTRRVLMPKEGRPALRMDAAAEKLAYTLVFFVNGKEIKRVEVSGKEWQSIEVDLSSYAGQEIEIQFGNLKAGKAGFYFDAVRISG